MLCLLVLAYEALRICTSNARSDKKFYLFYIFPLCLYLIIRILCIVVPFPFSASTLLLVCDQAPRYFIFVSWQYLSYWISVTIVTRFSRNKKLKTCLAILFLFLFTTLLCLSLFIIYSKKVCKLALPFFIVSVNQSIRYLRLLDSINFGLILISILLNIISFVRTLRHTSSQDNSTRLKIILIILILIFISFLLRTIYVILSAFGANFVVNYFESIKDEVFSGSRP